MNKILKLFDNDYVTSLFTKKVLPLYPDFVKVKKIKIHAHKKHVWEDTYHVVIEFSTIFVTKEGKKKKLAIFCSAHSDEPRKNVYKSLKFLWENGFGKGYLSIPHPLFYSNYFKGTFYRGVVGKNLYHYIREKNFVEIESIIAKTAAWFAKLHNLPIEKAINFNKENSRIETVFPGIDHIIWRINKTYPKYSAVYKEIYNTLNNIEKAFLQNTKRLWLVHGDAHPENIIKMSARKIALIDFTDLCLSDFARDLGSFLQQLEFMSARKIGKQDYTEKIKKIFLDEYFAHSHNKLDRELEKRMDNYYNWTAMRTATYFLIKDEPEPLRAYPIIKQVCDRMNIKV